MHTELDLEGHWTLQYTFNVLRENDFELRIPYTTN